MRKKGTNKALIAVGSVLATLLGLFLLLYLVLALIGCAMYGEARKERLYVCPVAGIKDGNAPQGIAFVKEKNLYIQTGYDGDNITLLYIVEDGVQRRVRLLNENGEEMKGHAGGVTCTKDCVYVAQGSTVVMFSLDELTAAEGDTPVKVKQVYAVDNNSSFCFSDDENLYVGEFYRAGNYETDSSHHFTTPGGDENKAIVSVYKLGEDGELGSEGEQPYPEYCISITGLVQGFATANGTFVLSRSYGLKNSSLEYYSAPTLSDEKMTVKFKKNKEAEERQVPLYYLDSSNLFKTLTLPSFSEDLTIADGRVVVTNEASANKYFVGKLFGANKVYSYPLYTNGERE